MCDINATRNLVQLIERLIIEKHYDGITVLLQDNKSLVTLKECITDVIQICLLYMTDDVYLENMELYACCEELLRAIALHAGQDEVLFEFLEIIETTKSESVFVSVLKALQMCLMRKGEHKARALEWSLNSIQSYLSELKYPEMLDKEYDEKQERLLEEDSQVHKILTNYITISLFYEPILKEISLDFSKERDAFKDTKITRKNVLSCFFLQLLGKPLALLDLSNRNKPTNVHSLQCARDSVESFLKLVPDPFFLLPYVERRIRWKVKFPKDGVYEIASRDIFLIEDKAPLVALGVFYYLIISEGLIPENAPKIYRKLYLFEMCLYLVDHLLQCPEGTLQYKGICLGTQLLNDLGSELLESDTLDIKIHSSFCSSLTKVLVYSNLKRNRKNGILLLKKYILQFRDDGKFFLLKNLIRITTHNGLLGYLIIVYKNLIADRLNNEDGTPLSPYFCGSEFRTLILKYICHLNNSIETDLMQNSDQIISALNIIRFFVLRDTQNRTGVWDFLEEIQEKYLKPLRSALDISRAHYKAEEFRVREGRDDDDELKGILQLSTLMGEEIPDITKEKKLEMLANAMLTFDLVESLLARVNECIDTTKDIKICRQFRTITALTGFDSASHKPKSQTKYSSHKDNAGNVSSIVLLATGLRLQYTVNRYNSSGSSNAGSTTASTIEEFRAREEQREEEFSKQQEKQETSSPQSEASEEKVNAIKTKILEASLPFVSTYGWTRQALTQGSEAAGYPGVIHGLFPNGGAELIRYFLNKSNESLVEHMAKETNNGETQVSDVPEFLHRMVKLRLQMIEPYISHWPQALAIMSLPQNVQMALAQLLTMVDDICYYSGDRSVEFKWYARRVGLATIFKVTELFMLQDSSVDHQTTWAFLKNRIDEATQIESFMTQTENFAQKVPNGLTSAFVTARNILGLDFKRR